MGVSKRRKLTAALARKSGIAGLARASIGDAQALAIDTTGIKALFYLTNADLCHWKGKNGNAC